MIDNLVQWATLLSPIISVIAMLQDTIKIVSFKL